jgi:hypothetical protein
MRRSIPPVRTISAIGRRGLTERSTRSGAAQGDAWNRGGDERPQGLH